jgi:hypothetical protein
MGDAMSGPKKFVFCEGKDDVAVIRSLAKNVGLVVTIEDYGGRNKLTNFLQGLSKRPEFAQEQVAAIAILRDADDDAVAAFASVRDTLRQNGFEAPDANENFKVSTLRVGVFIVGVNGKGMIEDLCLKSVADRPEFACVDTYFGCVAQHSKRKEFHSKARFRVWMASQDDYKYDAGKAAEEGYWPWENPGFDGLKNFLRAL